MKTSKIRTRDFDIPLTPRLAREAAAWDRRGARPAAVVVPNEHQESVWDYPRPPAVQQVLDLVTIDFGGQRIVSSERVLRVCETASPPTYYVPIEEVADYLRPAQGSSFCEWKGDARYHSIALGAHVAERSAWSYPSPTSEYEVLRDHVGIYARPMDRCTVGGHEVTPQPGQFYAGWVTPDLSGPFKGSPGSAGW